MTMDNTESDIIVVGAGLVGLSQTLAGLHQNFKIQVLSLVPIPETDPTVSDLRPLTLSYASYLIFRGLGLWDLFSEKSCPIESVEVSEKGALGTLCFRAADMHVPALGFVVPFEEALHQLYQKVKGETQIQWTDITSLQKITPGETGVCIEAETPEGKKEFKAELLIAADGTRSTVRELLSIAAHAKKTQEVAFTAKLQLERAHDRQAFERFVVNGTVAVLPLWNPKECALVWTLPKAEGQALLQMEQKTVLKKIDEFFFGRLPTIQGISHCQIYPVQTCFAQEQIQPGVVLLGNAAHTLYPLAAQGFNLSLRDVAVLTNILSEARKQQHCLGTLSILKNYYKERLNDQKRTIGLTTNLSHWFGLKLPLLNRVRGLGLLGAELFPPLKRKLAIQAMGLEPPWPPLMRETD